MESLASARANEVRLEAAVAAYSTLVSESQACQASCASSDPEGRKRRATYLFCRIPQAGHITLGHGTVRSYISAT